MTYDHIEDSGFSSSYFKKSDPPSQAKAGYWKAAFGLQQVDGLTPSPYARALADQNVRDELTIAQVGELLEDYHATTHAELSPRTNEADIVSQRIVKLLSDGWFTLTPSMLPFLHQELFNGINDATYRPGAYKDDLYYKCEPILNGDSVMYAAPGSLDAFINSAFAHEERYQYSLGTPGRTYLSWADAQNLADFLSRIWGAHPFIEGNTRTMAVFAELYLRDLGIDVDNTLFEQGSSFFRNALVRASYANPRVGIARTCEFLVQFLSKLVDEPNTELDQRSLWCKPLFEHPDAVRNVPLVDARPMQDELKRSGITKHVLAG